jgi:HK97 gp10 family phage protein
MGRARLDLSGLRETERRLSKLARTAARQIVQPAIVAALGVVAERIRIEAPVETGTLAGGIEVITHPARAATVSAEASTTAAPYAGHRDLGTEKMPPDPFVQRAAAASRDKAMDKASAAIARGIEEALR